jgi:hypothetical protein
MTDHDDGNDGEAGDSSVRCILTATHGNKCQARLPTDHFKGLLEEAYKKHVYPFRHKLKDCGMMRSFVTLGSLTRGLELDEDPDRSDTTPFPGENVVMAGYGGRPPLRGCRMSNLCPRTLAHCGRGYSGSRV